MKRILILVALLASFFSYSQSTVTVKHKAYKTTFDKTKYYPTVVEWWLTKKMVSCNTKTERTDAFGPDPKLEKETDLAGDYKGSGYDRGHNFPAADAACNETAMKESFYFSNMTPQTPQLNRGDWKTLEEATRLEAEKNDSIRIWCGAIGEIKRIGRVSVPEKCWKVIYIKKTNSIAAFLFDNNDTKPDGYVNNKVDVAVIERLTGLKF